MENLRINERIKKIEDLINDGHYKNSVEDGLSLIEDLLKFLYKEISLVISIKEKEKLIEYEKKIGKTIKKFMIGELIGLFHENKLLNKVESIKKVKLNYLKYPNLWHINDIRVSCTHDGYETSYIEAMYIFFLLINIFVELKMFEFQIPKITNVNFMNSKAEMIQKVNKWKYKYCQTQLMNINEKLEIKPQDLPSLNLKIYCLARLNRKKEALETIENLIKLAPNNGNYFDTYGEILLMFKNYSGAIEKFEYAIGLDVNDFYIHETYIKMGRCYLELGKYDLALKNIQRGIILSKQREKHKWINKGNKYLDRIKNVVNKDR